MCDPVTIGLGSLAVAAVGTGASIIQGNKSMKMQKAAGVQARKDAVDTKAANERAINRANQKTPSLASLFGSNRMGASAGVGSTMLTGAGGAQVGGSLLGRTTLLGG